MDQFGDYINSMKYVNRGKYLDFAGEEKRKKDDNDNRSKKKCERVGQEIY